MKLEFKTRTEPPPKVPCPNCRTNTVFVQMKPYCPSCLWNLGNVRRHLWGSIRGILLGAIFGALWFLALPGFGRWFLGGWLLFVLIPIGINIAPKVRDLIRLPKLPKEPTAAPEPRPLPYQATRSVTLRWKTPQQSVLVNFAVTMALPIVVLVVGFHGDPSKYFPTGGSRVAALFLALWFGYAYVAHAIEVARAIRDFVVERRLAIHSELTTGLVILQAPSEQTIPKVTYEFRDPNGEVRRGRGRDFSRLLYEGMETAIVYDREHPEFNMPVAGLMFHKLESEAGTA